MVKNTTGGSGSKRMARKNMGNKQAEIDMSDPLILTVSVSKALGNSRFYVLKPDNSQLICHIPSRFSGRNKHNNFVTVNSLILVSLREFENPAKTCDYIRILQPTTPVSFFTNGAKNVDMDDEIVFKNDNSQPLEIVSEEKTGGCITHTMDFSEINFDDI